MTFVSKKTNPHKKIKKEDFGEKFAHALNEVLMPALSDMHDDIVDLKERLEQVDNRVEMFLRQSSNVGDYHAGRLDNHEKRIKKLERSVLGGKPDKES